MRFAIVIPTYNSLKTLPAAVESALAQTYIDFHVWVSDNASTDGSVDYLRGLSNAHLTVVLNEKNLGKTENWNRAFNHVREVDYLVMLHSDDILYPDALKALAMAAAINPCPVMIYGSHDRLSLDGHHVVRRRIWPLPYVCSSLWFKRMQSLSNGVSVVGVAFKKDVFQRVGGFPVQYQFVQDVMLYEHMALHGNIVYCPFKLGLYRDTPIRPSLALKWSMEQMLWMRQLVETVWPKWVSRLLLAWHADGERLRIMRESSSDLQFMDRWLAANAVSLDKPILNGRRIRAFGAKFMKLVFSLNSSRSTVSTGSI